MVEVLKIIATLVGGGLAGALLSEWLRRKRSRVQRIPLIERVNRLVNPELQGFALARIVGAPSARRLEEVKNLREYQLTMRNSSSTHLQDAEVQFEFPADDVQAWASRPALSKTALIPVNATATIPWRMAFRWKIPHLPAGDSVEFTFQAINPSSDKFEVALYHPDGVIFERVVGEPPSEKRASTGHFKSLTIAFLLMAVTGAFLVKTISDYHREVSTVVTQSGCNLRVTSAVEIEDPNAILWWRAGSKLKYRLLNAGGQDCVVQSPKLLVSNPSVIRPGEAIERESFSQDGPEIANVDISVGTNSASAAATVRAYVKP
jgi:hypothetical protein